MVTCFLKNKLTMFGAHCPVNPLDQLAETKVLIYLGINKYAGLWALTAKGPVPIARIWVLPNLKDSNKEKGEADFAVAAEGEKITVYLDGVKAFIFKAKQINTGDIGYALLSGTNAGFGTSCKMTKTRVWKLE